MLEFPEKYYESEVRDGFYVPGKMKRFWASQLEVMVEVDRICRKYNITYYAEWGTLLGAVRHHGFIPWDDDMDITMKREDYVKFLSVADKELGGRYHVINYHNNDDYWDIMARVINSSGMIFNDEFLSEFHDSPYVSGVDIFPMDYLPRDPEQQQIQKDLIVLIKTVADCYGAGVLQNEELDNMLNHIEYITARKLDREKPLQDQLYDLFTAVYAMYREDEADNLAQIALWVDHENPGYPKEFYDEVIYMPFENIELPVPAGYDAILKRKYGNYMRLVKGGGNSTHNYPLYKVQEQDMVERANVVFPKYEYNPDELKIERETGLRQNLKPNAHNLINLFKNATGKIETVLGMGQPAVALELLNQCQDGAIQLGTMIESVAGEGCATVKLIEEYCELIFQVYQAIAQAAEFEPSAVCSLLLEQLGIIDESVEDIIVKRVVVFMPFREDTWKGLEALWQEANEDPYTEAIVMPIPYFYRDYFGKFRNPVYCGDKLPEYVPVVDYESFDLENIHPDQIYIQNPYDGYESVTSVLPYFYASNLRKLTDELIYVPYFVTDEINWGNPRETDLMDNYVLTPGVALADKVIVQSEEMKESYIRKLVEWAGEDTRAMWYAKIIGSGHPLMRPVDELEAIKENIPDAWNKYVFNSDGTHKKTILYATGISALMEYKEKAIDKIERNLEIFANSKADIALIWRPQSKLIDNLKRLDPVLCKKYTEVVRKYLKSGVGIYDETPSDNVAITLCDGYYGDTGEIAQKMRTHGKPVMIQDIEL